MPKIIRLGLSPPSPHRKRHGPGSLGRQLQAAGTDHRQADKLADNGAQTAEGQALLHVCQNILFPIGFDEDDAVGMEANLGKSRKEQIRPRQAPDDGAFGARGNAGDTKGCSRTIDGARAAACKLMQRSIGETTTRQGRIDFGNAKGQRSCPLRGSALDRRDAVA